MIKQFLIRRITTQEIEYAIRVSDVDPSFVGPASSDNPAPTVPPVVEPGCEAIEWAGDTLLGKSPSPTAVLRWDGEAPAWTEGADLQTLVDRKNAEINAARLAANQSYFEFDGKEIACDALSMIDIQSANAEIALTRVMPANWPGYWKARDNTYASVHDVDAWTRFIQAMVARGTAHFDHAQVLKAQLAVATTPAQISVISWSA